MSNSESGDNPPTQIRKLKATSPQQKTALITFVLDSGYSISDAADMIGINPSTARGIVKRYRDNGGEFKKKVGDKTPKKLTPLVLVEIEAMVENNHFITLKKMKTLLAAKDIFISQASIFNALQKLKLTLKLARCEVDRMNAPEIIAKRKVYARHFHRHSPPDKKKCIFVDECGYNLHLRRKFARSKSNTRANVVIPTVRGRNVTLIAAINNECALHYKIITDTTCNSVKFCDFLKELLDIISQDDTMKECWIILDNAQIHKTKEVKKIMENSQHKLIFLSPYSPQLNPIENAFSKIKNCVRTSLADSSDQRTLKEAIENGINAITTQDYRNYSRHMSENITTAFYGQPMH